MLNVHDAATVADFSKADGDTVTTSATCTANAMGVVFGLHWQTKVEHMADGWHVDTTCCHVGSDQNLHMAFTQCLQAAVAHALVQSAMQCHGAEAFLLQVIGQAVALNLRIGKHNGLFDTGIAQPMVEQFAFVL